MRANTQPFSGEPQRREKILLTGLVRDMKWKKLSLHYSGMY